MFQPGDTIRWTGRIDRKGEARKVTGVVKSDDGKGRIIVYVGCSVASPLSPEQAATAEFICHDE